MLKRFSFKKCFTKNNNIVRDIMKISKESGSQKPGKSAEKII